MFCKNSWRGDTVTTMNELKRWFWGFFLGQLLIWGASFVYLTGTVTKTVGQNTEDIKELKIKVETKADKEMVMRIKTDNERVQTMILEDVRYIRLRFDEYMEKGKR
jgi:LEA14-like dessication related protein